MKRYIWFAAPIAAALALLLSPQCFAAEGGPNPKETKGAKMFMVKIETSKGTIIAELNGEKAPETVRNFLSYANEGFYNGTIFHRVIDGFMIQGGGFTPDMKLKEGNPPIRNEAANGLKNRAGTLAMARTSVVDSATSQFFINLVDNGFLDQKDTSPSGFGYAVFGRVVKGMDVVTAIGGVPTGNVKGFGDVPVEPVVIEKITFVE
jgi:cyclophilin family peptidyl-prolyl cis-trans isomerase